MHMHLRGWRVTCGAAVCVLMFPEIPRTPILSTSCKIGSAAIQTFEDYTSVNVCNVRNGTILRWLHSLTVKADSER